MNYLWILTNKENRHQTSYNLCYTLYFSCCEIKNTLKIWKNNNSLKLFVQQDLVIDLLDMMLWCINVYKSFQTDRKQVRYSFRIIFFSKFWSCRRLLCKNIDSFRQWLFLLKCLYIKVDCYNCRQFINESGRNIKFRPKLVAILEFCFVGFYE